MEVTYLRSLVTRVPHSLQSDMFGDVPSPVGSVATQRTLEGLLVEMTDDVNVETRCRGGPERAMWAFIDL